MAGGVGYWPLPRREQPGRSLVGVVYWPLLRARGRDRIPGRFAPPELRAGAWRGGACGAGTRSAPQRCRRRPSSARQLEDAAVDLPVAKLLGLEAIMTQVSDMQPVAEIVEHHAALAPEGADWPGFPDSLDVCRGSVACASGRSPARSRAPQAAGTRQTGRCPRRSVRCRPRTVILDTTPSGGSAQFGPFCRTQPYLAVVPRDEIRLIIANTVNLGANRYRDRVGEVLSHWLIRTRGIARPRERGLHGPVAPMVGRVRAPDRPRCRRRASAGHRSRPCPD